MKNKNNFIEASRISNHEKKIDENRQDLIYIQSVGRGKRIFSLSEIESMTTTDIQNLSKKITQSKCLRKIHL